MKNALIREWCILIHSDDVKILYANPNVYTVTVQSEVVAQKLIDQGHWYVNDDVFSLQKWQEYASLDEVIHNKATFWVQAHGIHLGQLTAANARKIEEKIGNCVAVEDPDVARIRGFLRMRLEVTTTSPLPVGFHLARSMATFS